MPPHFFARTFSAQKRTGACAACAASFGPADPAAHFYGELRSVAEQVVPQLKRQAQERRAEEGRRSSLRRMCGKPRSVAAQAQVFSEAHSMAFTSWPSLTKQLGHNHHPRRTFDSTDISGPLPAANPPSSPVHKLQCTSDQLDKCMTNHNVRAPTPACRRKSNRSSSGHHGIS